MPKKIPTETQEQTWVIQWSMQPSVRTKFQDLKYLFHIPNERSDKVQAAILKRMGVKKGVPDLCLPVPKGKHHGLWIEMKRIKDGVVSDDQRWWKENLESMGYIVAVCRGWQQAVNILCWYLELGGDGNGRNQDAAV